MMSICKWCGDRYGGCMYCGDEIAEMEKERTERIKNWTPPPDWLIEFILNPEKGLDIETGTPQDRFAAAVLIDKVSHMSEEEREAFAASLQVPPPLFSAPNDDDGIEVLKRHYNARVVTADFTEEGRPDIYERAEQARIELLMRQKTGVDKLRKWQR